MRRARCFWSALKNEQTVKNKDVLVNVLEELGTAQDHVGKALAVVSTNSDQRRPRGVGSAVRK